MSGVDPFGPGATLHHVGIAVRSMQEAGPDLCAVHDPVQKVSVAFTELHGLPVEFIEPSSESSPISRSLQAGQRLQHVCFEVDDLEDALASGRRAGFHMIARPTPAAAFDGRRIAWVFHKVFGLTELLERRTPG